jgi:hypothetical protein
MANADRNSKDSVLRELKDRPSELTEALHTVETEAPHTNGQLESTVLQINCWSGGSNAVSSACWDGNRIARLKLSSLHSPRRCAHRQRSRLTARAETCSLIETGDYLVD